MDRESTRGDDQLQCLFNLFINYSELFRTTQNNILFKKVEKVTKKSILSKKQYILTRVESQPKWIFHNGYKDHKPTIRPRPQ